MPAVRSAGVRQVVADDVQRGGARRLVRRRREANDDPVDRLAEGALRHDIRQSIAAHGVLPSGPKARESRRGLARGRRVVRADAADARNWTGGARIHLKNRPHSHVEPMGWP